jgi:hypothetical protein
MDTHLPSRLVKVPLTGRVSLVAQPEAGQDGIATPGPMLGIARLQPAQEPGGLHNDGDVRRDLPYDSWQLREMT